MKRLPTITVVLAALGLLSSAAYPLQKANSYQVQLDWIQSETPNITGNCIYRSTGNMTSLMRLACVSPPITQYMDGTVQNGRTYTYAVTAMEGAEESQFSNMIEMEIPQE